MVSNHPSFSAFHNLDVEDYLAHLTAWRFNIHTQKVAAFHVQARPATWEVQYSKQPYARVFDIAMDSPAPHPPQTPHPHSAPSGVEDHPDSLTALDFPNFNSNPLPVYRIASDTAMNGSNKALPYPPAHRASPSETSCPTRVRYGVTDSWKHSAPGTLLTPDPHLTTDASKSTTILALGERLGYEDAGLPLSPSSDRPFHRLLQRWNRPESLHAPSPKHTVRLQVVVGPSAPKVSTSHSGNEKHLPHGPTHTSSIQLYTFPYPRMDKPASLPKSVRCTTSKSTACFSEHLIVIVISTIPYRTTTPSLLHACRIGHLGSASAED
ncbi:hypothetical protein BKA70DRAFT_1435097 [Coprinopsis sp. MPI-PUGE-AT-0042]|nr:hypothetical protein BKA70DRAFT_1435097 [Coprinopsis sp. MPI-PUGE-AT-0042]